MGSSNEMVYEQTSKTYQTFTQSFNDYFDFNNYCELYFSFKSNHKQHWQQIC